MISPSIMLFSSSNCTMTIEKAVTNDYHTRGNFSRIFFKNKSVQTNSNSNGYVRPGLIFRKVQNKNPKHLFIKK